MRPTPIPDTPSPCWVFGYGSLIWRTGFPYLEARMGLLRGYKRRFWQGSVDHRGVPGAPGRVVTLAPDPAAACWGRAYLLDPDHTAAVLQQLDDREVGGYSRHSLSLTLEDGSPCDALTWVAWPDNPNYLGPASVRAIAKQAAAASGPSGSNTDYVLRLAAALEGPVMADRHVSEVAQRVRQLAPPRQGGAIPGLTARSR